MTHDDSEHHDLHSLQSQMQLLEYHARMNAEHHSRVEKLRMDHERLLRVAKEEREALKKEKDSASKERLKNLERELAEFKEEHSRLKAQWLQEKEQIKGASDYQAELEKLKLDAERLEREGQFEKVAEIRYGLIPELEQKIASAKTNLKEQSDQNLTNKFDHA